MSMHQQNLTIHPNDEIKMKIALEGVMTRGETPSYAARKYGIKRTAILYRLLEVRKKEMKSYANPVYSTNTSTFHSLPVSNIKCELKSIPPSKCTSHKLLLTQREKELIDFIKTFYFIKHEQPKCTTLLPEVAARKLVFRFVRSNSIKYPLTWDRKKQAGAYWFKGFVERNPEVMQYVELASKIRVNRKTLNPNSNHEFGHWRFQNADSNLAIITSNSSNENYSHHHNTRKSSILDPKSVQSGLKVRPLSDLIDGQTNNLKPYIGSIAQNVKMRTSRKPRVIPEALYPLSHTRKNVPKSNSNYYQKRFQTNISAAENIVKNEASSSHMDLDIKSLSGSIDKTLKMLQPAVPPLLLRKISQNSNFIKNGSNNDIDSNDQFGLWYAPLEARKKSLTQKSLLNNNSNVEVKIEPPKEIENKVSQQMISVEDSEDPFQLIFNQVFSSSKTVPDQNSKVKFHQSENFDEKTTSERQCCINKIKHHNQDSKDNIEKTLEKIRCDMNCNMKAIIQQLMENNRLLQTFLNHE